MLYRTLEGHLETFLARASDQGGGDDGLPAFVTLELRAYLQFGLRQTSWGPREIRLHANSLISPRTPRLGN